MTVKSPATTTSGTDVTLTILVEGPGSADSNYAVLRLSVLAEVFVTIATKAFKEHEENLRNLIKNVAHS